MKKNIIIAILATIIVTSGIWLLADKNFTRKNYAPSFPNDDVSNPQFFAIFDGQIPCTSSEILNGCQVIKMRLTLFKDLQKTSPTTYKLNRIYVGLGNDVYTTQGNWAQTADKKTIPSENIYQLDEKTPQEYRFFLTVGKNILLGLDQDQNIKVGNTSANYTLSRTR